MSAQGEQTIPVSQFSHYRFYYIFWTKLIRISMALNQAIKGVNHKTGIFLYGYSKEEIKCIPSNLPCSVLISGLSFTAAAAWPSLDISESHYILHTYIMSGQVLLQINQVLLVCVIYDICLWHIILPFEIFSTYDLCTFNYID